MPCIAHGFCYYSSAYFSNPPGLPPRQKRAMTEGKSKYSIAHPRGVNWYCDSKWSIKIYANCFLVGDAAKGSSALAPSTPGRYVIQFISWQILSRRNAGRKLLLCSKGLIEPDRYLSIDFQQPRYIREALCLHWLHSCERRARKNAR